MKTISKVLITSAALILTLAAMPPVALAADGPLQVGDIARVFCSTCGKWRNLEIIEILRETTCTVAGRGICHCTTCGNDVTYTIQPALGHDWVETDRVEPSGVHAGSVKRTCSRCGEVETEILPAIVNVYCSSCHAKKDSEVVRISREATCTASGITVYRCLTCNTQVTAFYPSALGHNWVETDRVEPSGVHAGSVKRTCSRCGEVETEVLPAIVNVRCSTCKSYKDVEVIKVYCDATCTGTGLIRYRCLTCSSESAVYYPSALGHDWVETNRVDATCTAPGFVERECSRCKEMETETLLGGHVWELEETVPPVYDSNGLTVSQGYSRYHCSKCGDSHISSGGAAVIEDGAGGDGMQDTTAALGKTFLSGIWGLFGIYVPGFSFTFGQMWLGVLLASISVLVVRMIFGFGGGPRGESPRTSSTNHARISKERRHDEF